MDTKQSIETTGGAPVSKFTRMHSAEHRKRDARTVFSGGYQERLRDVPSVKRSSVQPDDVFQGAHGKSFHLENMYENSQHKTQSNSSGCNVAISQGGNAPSPLYCNLNQELRFPGGMIPVGDFKPQGPANQTTKLFPSFENRP